jgi:hypothetical protein
MIGGMFALAEALPRAPRPVPWDENGDALELVDARSALQIVRDLVRPNRVWLPAYLCDSMIAPLSRDGSELCWYPTDARLRVIEGAWQRGISAGDLVIVISYFGFPADSMLAEYARARGAYVALDGACALLTRPSIAADFVVLSPRKFVGIPDGGSLLCARPEHRAACRQLELAAPPQAWWQASMAALQGRPAFDRGEARAEWLECCERAEEAPLGPFAISQVSRRLLATAFDWDSIAMRRRENYRQLLERLQPFALYPELPDHVVPFGFPLRSARRDALRSALRSAGVLTPVHWSLPTEVPVAFEHSWQLSTELLTLPCDQRYDAADMQELAGLVMAAGV